MLVLAVNPNPSNRVPAQGCVTRTTRCYQCWVTHYTLNPTPFTIIPKTGLCDKNNKILPVLGYLLLGMAGPFLQMPCFQFTELFGEKKVRYHSATVHVLFARIAE